MSEDKVEQKLMSAEALGEIEALCATAVMRSPGDFKIGEYQRPITEEEPDPPKYNLFLTAKLASKKGEKKRIVTL